MLIHGGNVFIIAGPEDFLPALAFAGLIGQQGGGGFRLGQPQLVFVGVVGQRGQDVLAGCLDAGEGQLFHHKVNIHRVTLHAVLFARLRIGGLPDGIRPGVAQRGIEPRDPEIIAPAVKRGVRQAAAGPVDGGVNAFLALVAQFFQAVEKYFGQVGHLVRVQAGDGFILQVIIDRVTELVGGGGVIVQPLVRGCHKAQQAGNVFGFRFGLFLGGGVRVQIGAKGDAKAGAFVCVAAPLFIVLGVIAGAVPLAAKAAADHGKIDPGGLGFLPVHFTLILAHVNAFFGGGQNRLSVTVKVVPGIVLGPRSGTGAGVNGQGGFLPAVAGYQPDHYQRHNGNQHARGQCKTQVGLLLLFGLWAAALRGLGLGLFAVGLAGLLFRLAGLPRRLFVLFHRRFPL